MVAPWRLALLPLVLTGARTYRSGDGQVSAEFVEDVLFRYSVTSN